MERTDVRFERVREFERRSQQYFRQRTELQESEERKRFGPESLFYEMKMDATRNRYDNFSSGI